MYYIRKIKKVLRNCANRLPVFFQQELKRIYFRLQIKNGTFKSEEKEFELLPFWVKEGDYVIDVGANIGHYTVRLSELVGEKGRVFSIEPVPKTFEILASNVTCGKFTNVTLFNVAASDNECTVYMSIPKLDSGIDNYYQASIVDTISDMIIYCLPLSCIKFNKAVKLIKIDIEGHELSALIGFKELLERDHPLLIIEGASGDIREYLKRFGYLQFRIKESPNSIFKFNLDRLYLPDYVHSLDIK